MNLCRHFRESVDVGTPDIGLQLVQKSTVGYKTNDLSTERKEREKTTQTKDGLVVPKRVEGTV